MIRRIGTSTDPAKLKLAIIASHVVAAFTFFYMSFTHWAQTNIFASHPLLKLLVNLSVARAKHSMVNAATFEAYFLPAITCDFLRESTLSSNEFFTASLGTPPHHWV
jgi:hypothetical protein